MLCNAYTSIELVSLLIKYHLNIYDENLTGRVWVFDNNFVFDTIHVYILCKDLPTQVKSYQYQYGLELVLTQTIG